MFYGEREPHCELNHFLSPSLAPTLHSQPALLPGGLSMLLTETLHRQCMLEPDWHVEMLILLIYVFKILEVPLFPL